MNVTPLTPYEGCDIRTLIDDRAARRAEHPFLIWEPFDGEGKMWSYAAFGAAVRRFAAGLRARGVRDNERVLIYLENCPELLIAWLGCGYAGAVAVAANSRSSVEDIRYFATHSGAVGGVTQPRFAQLTRLAAGDLRWLVVTETNAGVAAEPSTFVYEPFAAVDGDAATLPTRAHEPLAPFSIQYTSGTTARPKGVVWTHANALWGAQTCAMHEALQPSDVHLVHLPLSHTNAQVYSALPSLWVGATIVLQPHFSASRFWPVSLKHRCTWTSLVPFCVKALLEQPVPEHSYRFWGNAVCEPPYDASFGVKTIGWYGMTETVAHCTVGSPHQPDGPMSIGRPSPAYDVYVLDEAGTPVTPGAVGDLYIGGRRGVSLFLEYDNDPVATAAAFREDGLFITGDRARLGDDGFLYFADRSKDKLKVGGENVSATEIEILISLVEGVREVAVVGKQHQMLDEVPVAFVIPHSNDDPELIERIMAACRENLASFKHPHEVVLVQAFPRTTLEKIVKSELRALFAERVTR